MATACSSEPAQPRPDATPKLSKAAARERVADNRAVRAGFAPAAPAPLETVSVDPVSAPAPGAILPPAERQYRYLGRWAANPQLCGHGAWRFRTRNLTTAGETKCDYPTVAAVPAGYRLNGSCRADGVTTEQTLRLSFDERARTMRVAGRTLGPVTLIYCGD